MRTRRVYILVAIAAVPIGAAVLFQPIVDIAAERMFAAFDPPTRQYQVHTRRGIEAIMASNGASALPIYPRRGP